MHVLFRLPLFYQPILLANVKQAPYLHSLAYCDVKFISSCCNLSSDECFSLTVQESKGVTPYQTFRSDKAPSKERRETLSRVLQGSTDQC